jgi:hypothetical protein
MSLCSALIRRKLYFRARHGLLSLLEMCPLSIKYCLSVMAWRKNIIHGSTLKKNRALPFLRRRVHAGSKHLGGGVGAGSLYGKFPLFVF